MYEVLHVRGGSGASRKLWEAPGDVFLVFLLAFHIHGDIKFLAFEGREVRRAPMYYV